jgi:hypothetical protein
MFKMQQAHHETEDMDNQLVLRLTWMSWRSQVDFMPAFNVLATRSCLRIASHLTIVAFFGDAQLHGTLSRISRFWRLQDLTCISLAQEDSSLLF